MLQLYNSLTNQKEVFQPRQAYRVHIYVCGSTVYDSCHLGHARVAINFDTIVRYLTQCGYEVNYVRNITDIDDKIIARAEEENLPFTAITEKYTQEMHADYQALRLLTPTAEPRATEHLHAIKRLITCLEKADYTYKTLSGDICYRVRKFPNYGKLSGKKIDELHSGARIAADAGKEDPLDFVLWKVAKPGEPSWESPWGRGRPGWHIECSAMTASCLGETIDIHGGGGDLIFPHHENEIAQSEAAHQAPLAKYWMHCGILMVQGKKMAKSLKNFITIQELLMEYDAEVIKYFIQTGHYRSPLDFNPAVIRQAKASLNRLYKALALFSTSELGTEPSSSPEERIFFAAMNDDFNTPQALAALFSMAKAIQTHQDPRIAQSLLKCGQLLGLLNHPPHDYVRGSPLSSVQEQEIIKLIKQREKARAAQEWEQADLLRQQLDELGISIQDTPNGTQWRKRL